ncbi:MAG: PQQ-binding-like beta-propeller repeat protein [Pirellulales bacterium]
MDVSNRQAPTKVGSCSLPGRARDIAVSDGFAYVAAQDGGLRVVDVSNPKAPSEVASYLPGVAARPGAPGQWGPVVDAVAVAGRYAYLTYNYVPKGKNSWSSLLQVLDVSNPKVPAELGSCEPERSDLFLGVAVAGKYAYVADKASTLWVVDISDPKDPKEMGSCEGISEPQDVVVAGNHAYVADDDGAMYIVDVSDPRDPKKVGVYADQGDRPGIAEAIAVAGRYAYVCDDGGGRLLVVDISDPTAPTEVASFEAPGETVGVVASGDYVYVNVLGGGLFILKRMD